jgi:hypothetical protein
MWRTVEYETTNCVCSFGTEARNQERFVQRHELGNKGFDVHDWLLTQIHPVILSTSAIDHKLEGETERPEREGNKSRGAQKQRRNKPLHASNRYPPYL